MRAVIQRVTSASVSAGDYRTEIGPGILVFLGVTSTDNGDIAERLAAKVAGLRVFEDQAGKMNLSLAEVGGEVLCISQFTLYGDVRRGNRPSFEGAAPPETARPLYEAFCDALGARGFAGKRGVFGAHMAVSLVNDGPLTIVLDSEDFVRPRRT